MTKGKLNIVFLGVISSIVLLTSCSDERETSKVQKSDIVESVYSSVVIEPLDMYVVNSSITGYLDRIIATAGIDVAAGDVMFHIRDIQSKNAANNALLSYELAQKNYSGDVNLIEDLRLELNSSELKRKNDSLNYARNLSLYDKKLLTKVELEQSDLAYTASKNAYKGIQNKLKRMERDLKNSVSQAKNNYGASLSRSEDAIIRSLISGRVYDVLKQQGEFVTVQEPIAVVGSSEKFKINMLIDEVDITRIKKGQKIIVTLEAYEDVSFEAEVTHITPKMDARTQTFEIEGVFKKLPSKLYMGLTGEGNIIVNEIKNATVIPREYLIEGNKVETESGIVSVKTGAMSLSHVQIISGLKVGELIYKPQ